MYTVHLYNVHVQYLQSNGAKYYSQLNLEQFSYLHYSVLYASKWPKLLTNMLIISFLKCRRCLRKLRNSLNCQRTFDFFVCYGQHIFKKEIITLYGKEEKKNLIV